MYECEYAREPVDYRLFFLRLLKKIWLIPLAAVLGAVVVGGIYYFVNMVVGDGHQYRAGTVYYVKYSTDESGAEADYYNYFTWNELITTDYFTDGMTSSMQGKITKEEVLANVTATVESDYRYLYTKSVSPDKAFSVEMEHKVAELMVAFANTKDEIESIEVVDVADIDDIEDISLIFINHAVILGAVIGLLAGILFFSFASCIDTSIYIPATLEKRYHLPVLGAPSMSEFTTNCGHFIGEKRAVLVRVDKGSADKEEADNENLKKYFTGCTVDAIYSDITEKSDVMDKLKESECIILVVRAGADNGKRIERVVEQLARQDIKITAFALVDEDKWLIDKYYK